jgi:hypothetical protein
MEILCLVKIIFNIWGDSRALCFMKLSANKFYTWIQPKLSMETFFFLQTRGCPPMGYAKNKDAKCTCL